MNGLAVCAGYDGLGLGVSIVDTDYRTVCYVEREAYAAALLATRMADGSLDEAPIWDDLGTFDGAAWRGCVDIVTAGLPCQPYSVAGQHKGHSDNRAIWPLFIELLEAVRAPLVLLENVPPFLRHFQPIGEQLSGLGYRYQAGIFSAAEVGASHLRERFFCLAYAVGESGGPAGADVVHAEGGSGALWSAEAEELERLASTGACKSTVDDSVLRRYEHSQQAVPPCRYGSFPPGPADREGWAAILSERPELAPAIESGVRGMADGLAPRVDRLRAAGNGVVPAVAALAFRTLARRLNVRLTSHYEGKANG